MVTHSLVILCMLLAAGQANRSTSTWKTKSFFSASDPELYAGVDEPRVEQPQYNKRALECSDSEIDDNDDYASFRGKKRSKKKARIEANRALNVSPSGSEVVFGAKVI